MNNQPLDSPQTAGTNAEAIAWWVRLDSGALNPQQQQLFEQWLRDPLHQQAFEAVCDLWGELEVLRPIIATAKPKQGWFKRFIRQLKPQSKSSITAWTMVPAICAVLLWFSPLSLWLQADFSTTIGETRSFKLSDGSTVFLNSNSALTVNINANGRYLTLLKGEAWFQVSPDKSRPFQVHAGVGTVTALGTAFNIRLQANKTDVTVTEHSVAISLDEAAQTPVKLAEGQRLSFDKQHGVGLAQVADSHSVTAWQRGNLVFQNQTLADVVAEINRYYSGHLMISDESIAKRRVNGVFHTDQPLAVIAALETSLGLKSSHVSDYLILLHQ
jgi:transmembrane sensor